MVLPVELDKVAMLEIWVVLDLVDGWWNLGGLEDGLNMLLEEVGNTN